MLLEEDETAVRDISPDDDVTVATVELVDE